MEAVVHNPGWGCWKKVDLGSTTLSKMTMEARAAYSNPSTKRNFATIEYLDNDGNINYQSFVSEANGANGHTEIQALNFLKSKNIPTENLLGLHSEYSPCVGCITTMAKQEMSNTTVTWDFNYKTPQGESARNTYINGR